MKKYLSSVLVGLAFVIGLSFSRQVVGLTPEQQAILNLLSLERIDDCQGGLGYKTLRVTGANLQVVNGLGTTDTVNGLGNVLVGYGPFGTVDIGCAEFCDNSGSHNIILGTRNSYSSYSGIVGGDSNQILGSYAIILSGTCNRVLGNFSVINTGNMNTVTGSYGSVINGETGLVNGQGGFIATGTNNQSDAYQGAVIGGRNNIADYEAVVVGGQNNHANGTRSVVSGGNMRSVSSDHDWAAGSLFEDN
jgi:hypothetical protein